MGLLKQVSFMMQLVEKNMDVLRSLEGHDNDENEDEENGTALDENTVNQMIDLSGEEVKLCRNFEDRLAWSREAAFSQGRREDRKESSIGRAIRLSVEGKRV